VSRPARSARSEAEMWPESAISAVAGVP